MATASSRTIYVNESTAGLRTVAFAAFNSDGTAKTDLTAATALIHTNFGTGVASTANFAHLRDQYYTVVLTQAEVNLAANTHLLVGPADGAGYVIVCGEAVVVDPPITTGDIRDDAIEMFRDGTTRPNTTGNATFKDSSGSTVNVAVTTDADALPIVSTDTPA